MLVKIVRYLLDLYHVSKYLHDADKGIAALGSDWAKARNVRLSGLYVLLG